MPNGHARRNADLLVGICLLLLALSQSFLVACKPQPSSGEVAPIKEEPQSPMLDAMELQDMVMTRSPARMILGKDLGPVCIIEGRIKNNSLSDITAVAIRVSIRKGNTEVDGSDLRVESLVPGGEVRSFRQQIQAKPPKSGMHWTYEVIAVETDSREATRPESN